MKEKIEKILNGYKNFKYKTVTIAQTRNSNYACVVLDYATIVQMRLAAKKILKSCPDVSAVLYDGMWTNYIYTRETLKRAE